MFDPVSLATTVVGSFLLPYVKKGAGKIGEVVSEKFGQAAAQEVTEIAGKLWNKVKGAFTSEDELTTLNLFAKNPETFQKPVEQMLQQKLEKDPTLAQDVQSLVNAPAGGNSNAASIMNASIAGILDMRGAQVSNVQGGVFAGVVYGSGAPPPPIVRPIPPTKDPKDNS
jgi:hypothetical protein